MAPNQPPACSPLTDEHCQIVDGVLELCRTQDELLGLCQQSGMNVDPYVKENIQAKQWAAATKAVFFPHKP